MLATGNLRRIDLVDLHLEQIEIMDATEVLKFTETCTKNSIVCYTAQICSERRDPHELFIDKAEEPPRQAARR